MVLDMGVKGAAYATVAAQAFSGILCVIYMKKRYEILSSESREQWLNRQDVQELLVTGLPMGLQSSITAIGSVMLQSAVNMLGIVYVSAYTAVSKIKQFTINPYIALDTAVTTFTSQNYGAGKLDRVSRGLKAGMDVFAVYSVVIGVFLTFAGDKIALIFVDASETEVIGYVQMFFRYCGMFYLVVIVLDTLRSVIQGLGYSIASMAAGICEFVCRAVMSLWLIPLYSYTAVCFTDASAWIAAALCVSIMYPFIMRKIRKQQTEAGQH